MITYASSGAPVAASVTRNVVGGVCSIRTSTSGAEPYATTTDCDDDAYSSGSTRTSYVASGSVSRAKRPSESVAAAPLDGDDDEVAVTCAPARGAPDRASTTRPRSTAPCISMSNVPLAAAVYFVWY